MNSESKGINLLKINKYEDQNIIYLPINTIKAYNIPQKTEKIYFYDFTDKYDYNIKYKLGIIGNNNMPLIMNTIIRGNKKYLFISQKKDNFYLFENNSLKKVDNKLTELYKSKNFEFLIILDNKNIVAGRYDVLSFYKLNFVKYFNNINKYRTILSLSKLSNNRFCYLVKANKKENKLILYDEDFAEKEMTLKLEESEDENDLYENDYKFNIINLPNDNILIAENSRIVIIDINYFEIKTIFEIEEICYILPFNKNSNNNDDYFNNIAIIIKENETYFLKICDFSIGFKESKKININDIIDEENQLNIYTFFDMNYEYNKNGNIIFIISFNILMNDRLSILLDVDLNKIKYI